jgi:hypothetical protein
MALRSEQTMATPANGVRIRRQSTGTRPGGSAGGAGVVGRTSLGARSVVVTV